MFDKTPNGEALIIVDASSNHCGDMQLAKEMICSAAECGADYIKFQSWRTSKLKAGDPNYERHKKAELSDKQHWELIQECQNRNIRFLTSCFDIDRVEFLASLGMDMIKIPSPELTSLKMIQLLAEKFDRIVLSTGGTYTKEIEDVVSLLGTKTFALLHCVSIYPAPLNKANLLRMHWLKQFTPYVGFSDHSLEPLCAKIAIAMGACIIEKHFTLDKNLPGKDQSMSSTPEEIKEIVKFKNDFITASGKPVYAMHPEEIDMRSKYIGKWGNNKE